MGPLKSESFKNNAALASGLFYSDQRPAQNVVTAAATLAISYDAGTQSYTLSTGGNTMTFAPADSVNSGSTDFIAYQKTSGSVVNSLSLTKPGTSGALTYQYVGGGAWEHVNIGSNTLDFRYNPFTYGIATPDGALQRSGTGIYGVNLVGARGNGAPYTMAGTGSLQVDFLNGTLSSSGTLTTIDVSTGYVQSLGVFYGSASLSSTANSFSGTFAMDDGTRFTGGWAGRFYGPSNQEVGAVWQISSADSQFAAGWMIGRSDPTLTTYNTSLDPLALSEAFSVRHTELTFTDNGNGTVPAGSELYRANSTLSYDKSVGSFRYTDSLDSIDTTFAASNLVPNKTNSAVTVYEMTDSGNISYRLTLLNPGAGNPQIALTYTSFGHWEQLQSGSTNASDRWFAWGVRTNAFQIPTGTGHYDGMIAGKGATIAGGAAYTLSGTGSVDIDFGAGTFTGLLHPIGTSLADSSTRDFGTFNIANGQMDLDGGLSSEVQNNSGTYLGYLEGALYGPQANEIGGTFGFQTDQANVTGATYLNGVLVGTHTGN